MTVTNEEQKWLTANSVNLIGYYCTVCGFKMDPRLDGSWSRIEMHVLDHRRAGLSVGAPSGGGGVIAPRGGGG